MGKVAKLSRRAFVGLAVAGIPTAALAWRGSFAPLSRRSTAPRARGGTSASVWSVPYSPDYGERPVSVLAQLHDHTTNSDGSYTPAEVVALYHAAGYGALAITDHDLISDQPVGIATPILGCEHSPRTGHVGMIGGTYLRGAVTYTQEIVDGVVQSGGLAVLNHPSWAIGYSDAEIASLQRYVGIEIHNAACVGLWPRGRGFAVDRWDKVLTEARLNVWGFATDDFHRTKPWRGHDVGRTIVFARGPSANDIMDSLVKGCFVADVSNFGVTPGYPTVSREGIHVDCPGAVALRFVGAGGSLLAEVPGASAAYTFDGQERYVRIEAVGDYAEGFSTSLDWHRRWGQVDVAALEWRVADGILRQVSDTPDPKYAWLKRHLHGDFEVRVDCRIDHLPSRGQHPSGGLGLQTGQGHGYYLAPDIQQGELVLFREDGNVAVRLRASAEFTPAPGEWYSLRLERAHATGRIRARAWRRGDAEPRGWPIDVSDDTYAEGSIYLRATYAASFDNLYIRGFKTYYQPIPVTAV